LILVESIIFLILPSIAVLVAPFAWLEIGAPKNVPPYLFPELCGQLEEP
jgi:hypothetical protein